ncbi:MAG: PIN domain-containing protein [Ramlibacter sp.]
MILVDSNVLIDLMRNDPRWADWSVQQLRLAKAQDKLAINAVIYAELAAGYASADELDAFLQPAGISLQPISASSAFAASKAFMAYRKAKGVKGGVLPDFFIGAQAKVEGWRLLTRDAGRYRTHFPGLELICP